MRLYAHHTPTGSSSGDNADHGSILTVEAPAPDISGPPSWLDDAACVGSDIDMTAEPRSEEGQLAQLALCADCPVYNQCFAEFVTSNTEVAGMVAGLTSTEWRQLRRKIHNTTEGA